MNEKIYELIDENKFATLKSQLSTMNTVDIAQILEEVSEEKLVIIFRILPKEIAADVFSYISYEQQMQIIESITDKEIKNIVDELYFDDTIDFLEEMPANVVKRVLKSTDENKRKLINQFLNYPEYSAGSLMTIEYADLRREMTVEQALEDIRKNGVDKETINTCYVIDNDRKLEGVVSLRKIILSDEDTKIEDIMNTSVIKICTKASQEEAVELFKKYDLLSLPVVDNEDRLVGIITIDDIVDVIEEEDTEDFHKMAAIHPSEEEYLKTNVFTLARHRITWLLILMISATFTGNIITRFDDVIKSVVILVAFIPMLMNTGGSAGAQSSTLIIRSLALGEVHLRDILRVTWKELKISSMVGVTLSVVNFLRLYYLEKVDFNVAMTVCLTLFFTIMVAKLVGGALPIAAKALRMDPAIMASPLITTIVDAVALIIYFSIATVLLGI
jgi:magnesium transporter